MNRDTYHPSGQHSPPFRMLIEAMVGGVVIGAVAATFIIIVARWTLGLLPKVTAAGDVSVHLVLLVAGLAWLMWLVPAGAGVLAGEVASHRSRNVKISTIFAVITGLLLFATAAMILLRQYPSSGFHLVYLPILTLWVFYGAIVGARETASEPFCEECSRRCDSKIVGEAPAIPDTFSDISLSLNGIAKRRKHTEVGDLWAEVRVFCCPKCRTTGYVTATSCRRERNQHGKVVTTRVPVLSFVKLEPPEIETALNLMQPPSTARKSTV